ncbi:MAG: carbohydrate-binding domain-containing protein [Candidatus Woesearchaeota archaeon]|nr:MAG: carbohydrate-binding domain-containing protein [Candidatus Woesearchaeota archaeon]
MTKKFQGIILLLFLFSALFASCSEIEMQEGLQSLVKTNSTNNTTSTSDETTGANSDSQAMNNNQNTDYRNMQAVNQSDRMGMGNFNGQGTTTFEVEDFEAVDLSDLKIEDVPSTYDEDEATYITFDDDEITADNDDGLDIDASTLTIEEGGVYVLSGESDDSSIIISTDDEVQLVLNGVTLNSESTSAIVVENADKVIITLEDGTKNYIYDSSEYEDPDEVEEATPAAIYSKDDLYINGEGSLTIESKEKTGIQGKDQIIIVEGTLNIDAAKEGIKGKDFVLVEDADITITSGEDGISSTGTDDSGYVIIDDGSFDITADKDAIHSENAIIIKGGDLEISAEDDGLDADSRIEIHDGNINIEKSYEGIEAQNIYVLDGTIYITASDDGINVALASSTNTGMGGGEAVIDGALYVYGGYIYVVSGGDGLDSNGSIYMSGGTVIVNGPTSSANGGLDSNGVILVDGGTLAVSGSSGMAETASSSSEQNTVMITFTQTISAGETITIFDSDDNEVLAFEATKSYQTLVLSSELFETGEEYSIYIDTDVEGDSSNGLYSEDFTSTGGELYQSFTISSSSTTIGSAQNSMMGRGGNQMGTINTDQMNQGERPEFANNETIQTPPQMGRGREGNFPNDSQQGQMPPENNQNWGGPPQ